MTHVHFFDISFSTFNLLSFMVGMIFTLLSGPFSVWKKWLVPVSYFICVAIYYAWRPEIRAAMT